MALLRRVCSFKSSSPAPPPKQLIFNCELGTEVYSFTETEGYKQISGLQDSNSGVHSGDIEWHNRLANTTSVFGGRTEDLTVFGEQE